MHNRDTTTLLDALREHEEQKNRQHGNSRSQPRYIPLVSKIEVQFEQPGGSVSSTTALLVNLSRDGACIATRSYQHNGTKLRLNLIMNGGDTTIVHGTVRWCNYFCEQSHESGISFEEPIDPRHFISTDDWNESGSISTFEWTTQREALVLADDDLSFSVIKMLLKNANTTASKASSIGEAIDLVQKKSYDAIFLTDTSDTTAAESDIATLQANGYAGPILVESISLSSRKKLLLNAGATSVLQKPIQLAPLLTELRDSIEHAESEDAGSTPIFSTLTQKQCDDKSLEEYIIAISRSSKILHNAINNDDLDSALSVCNALLASGSGFGYPLISSTAMVVTKALNASGSCKESSIEIRSLIKLIARIHTRQAD